MWGTVALGSSYIACAIAGYILRGSIEKRKQAEARLDAQKKLIRSQRIIGEIEKNKYKQKLEIVKAKLEDDPEKLRELGEALKDKFFNTNDDNPE